MAANKTKSKKPIRVSLKRTVDSVMVHDMKNLAFRLSALLQNVEENYDNPLFKQNVTEILGDTIRKMNEIVIHFRENQQQLVVKLRVDLNQILTDLLNALPPRTTRNLQIDVKMSELPLIWGDPFYLHNAFHSMIQNAVEAMPDGGKLSVKTNLLSARNRSKICVEISDDGIGMNQSFLETKLFQPFVSTKPEGLGLGLFTCQQIFAMHQGKIEVQTAPGSGTTFRVLLPANGNAE